MLVTLQRNRILLALGVSAVFLFFIIFPAFAQQDFGFDQAADIGGGAFGSADLRDIIVNIVNISLGFLGVIAVIIIIYGGWLWMTSGGNAEKLDRAKKTLINAAIGFLIIVSSFAIVTFFTREFISSTGVGGPPGGGVTLGNGALGAGIIESVYPPPGASGIARNSSIFVTFKEPIDPGSLMNGIFLVETGGVPNVRIRKVASGLVLPLPGASVNVFANVANTVFVFDPIPNMGNAVESVPYIVELSNDILKADGSQAFPGAVGGIGFQWGFTVSNIIDITPPKLSSFLPRPSLTNYPRNVIISMRFNEAINPISVDSANIRVQIPAIPGTVVGAGGACTTNSGCTSGFCDTVATTCVGDFIVGTLFQASDYRTIEFLPNSECEGQPLNTCGEPVFCFPAVSLINTLVIADDTAPAINGIQDAASNSFDGDGDGVAEGPGATDYELPTGPGAGDNAFWDFSTNNTIDLTPPRILLRDPGPDNSASPGFLPNPDRELMIKFDKFLSISSIRPDSSYGDGKEYVTLLDPTQQVGYMTAGTNGNGCNFQCLNDGSDSVFGSVCGIDGDQDGFLIDPGEDCDDGNTRSGDGCSANCLHEGTATCGDGVVSTGEQCDDTNTDNNDGCSSICLLEGTTACLNFAAQNCCGNGQVEVGEACDDVNDPGCNAGASILFPLVNCLFAGNPGTPAGFCGDGIIQQNLGEDCDDGNSSSGDGCSPLCIKEGAACGRNANNSDSFIGDIDNGEDCDGTVNCSDRCINLGTSPLQCGNSNPDFGEDCDLGLALTESYVFIKHTGLAVSQQYGVRMGSGIRDLYQNCFLPSAESQASPYTNCRIVPGNTSFGWEPDPGGWFSFGGPTDFPNCILP